MLQATGMAISSPHFSLIPLQAASHWSSFRLEDDDPGTVLGKPLGHGKPHALGGAGQQRDLAGEIE